MSVRVTIAKDGDVAVWEGRAALVVVVREEQGQPLPLVSIRGGDAATLVYALAYLMAAVEKEVHPGAVEIAAELRHRFEAFPNMKRVVEGGRS